MANLPEPFARRILEAAIAEERSAEMLECLFDGGSVTVDAGTGQLVLLSGGQMSQLMGDG